MAWLLSTLLIAAVPGVAPAATHSGDEHAAKAKYASAHKHLKRHKHVVKRKHVVRHHVKRAHAETAVPREAKAEPAPAPERQAESGPGMAPEQVAALTPAARQALVESEQKFNQAVDNLPAEPESGPIQLGLRSNAALVVDQNTGKALYAKNPDMQTPIASITKLMTSVVVLDANLPMDEEITVTSADVDRLKHSSSRLPVGATLTRGELLHLALIASENRAAAALARTYPGGTAACVKAMNAKAAALGMTSTHYVEATGLDSENQSTAVDLAKLVNVASQYPAIHKITKTGEYKVDLPGYKVVRVRRHGHVRRVHREIERRVAFRNTNVLTRNPDWDIGLSKTGFINEAGHCLVMQARIGERKVIMVLLDSVGKMSRIGDAARVRRWLEGSGDD